MKKPNRIAKHSDSAPHGAQPKVVKPPKAATAISTASVGKLTLAELLSANQILSLVGLCGILGVAPGQQLAGAVGTWLRFARHFQDKPGGHEMLREAPGVLDPDQVDGIIAAARTQLAAAAADRKARSGVSVRHAFRFLSQVALHEEKDPGASAGQDAGAQFAAVQCVQAVAEALGFNEEAFEAETIVRSIVDRDTAGMRLRDLLDGEDRQTAVSSAAS